MGLRVLGKAFCNCRYQSDAEVDPVVTRLRTLAITLKTVSILMHLEVAAELPLHLSLSIFGIVSQLAKDSSGARADGNKPHET